MNKSIVGVFLVVLFASFTTGCDRAEKLVFGEKEYTYKKCIKNSFNGSHNYTANGTKKLCKEITNAEEPHYTYDNGKLTPSDEFTRCYDKEIKKLEPHDRKNKEKIEIAKLVCKYASN